MAAVPDIHTGNKMNLIHQMTPAHQTPLHCKKGVIL